MNILLIVALILTIIFMVQGNTRSLLAWAVLLTILGLLAGPVITLRL